MFLILPLLLHRCHRSKTQQKADENCMFPALDLHDRFTNSRLTTGRRGDWTTNGDYRRRSREGPPDVQRVRVMITRFGANAPIPICLRQFKEQGTNCGQGSNAYIYN